MEAKKKSFQVKVKVFKSCFSLTFIIIIFFLYIFNVICTKYNKNNNKIINMKYKKIIDIGIEPVF